MITDLIRQRRWLSAERVARALLARVESIKGAESLEAAEVLDLLSEAVRFLSTVAADERLTIAQRAVAIKEKLLGSTHPALAPSLTNLAVERARAGDATGAKPLLERAAVILEASLGPGHASVAGVLETLAGLLIGLGDADGAKTLIDRVLRIRESAPGSDDTTARTLINAGIFYAETNDYQGAQQFFERALAVADKAGRADTLAASSLTGLSVVMGLAGDYAGASRRNRELVARTEAAYGPVDPRLRFPLDALTQDLRDLGEYDAAQQTAERSLALTERAFGASHPAVAKSLHTLATIVAERGDYARATTLLERVAVMTQQGPPDPDAGPLWALNDVRRASGVLREDVAIFARLVEFRERRYGAAQPAVGDTLTELVGLLESTAEYRRTRPMLERALASQEEMLGPDHPDIAAIATNLATVLLRTGEEESGRRLYERALNIREKSLGLDHPKVAASLVNLGRLYSKDGRFAEARSLLDRALAIQEKRLGPEHPEVAVTLSSLADLAVRSGATREAFAMAARAEMLGREHMRLTARVLPERHALAYASSRNAALDLMLSVAAQRAGTATATTVWDAVVRSRGMIFDEMAARHRVATIAEDPETAALARALATARQRLATEVVRGIRNESPERYHRLLERAWADRDRAERALAERSMTFRADQSRKNVGLSELSLALPNATALVAFARYEQPEPSYLAFVLPARGGAPAVVPLGNAAAIDGTILRWRQQLEREAQAAGRDVKRGEAAYRRVALELRRQTWDRLAGYLPATTAQVFVVPDGALHLVSFDALPSEGSTYLVEHGPAIHHLSAERDLVSPDSGRNTGQGLLALGGPAFDTVDVAPRASASAFRGSRSACTDFQSMRFDPLPASLREVEQVASLWKASGAGEVVRLTGASASEQAFKTRAADHRVLHLATHGFFLGGRCASALEPSSGSTTAGTSSIGKESPLLLSGLVLAGANKRDRAAPEQDDGVLTAEEVASLNLRDVEWAVLSGCDTGTGEVKSGEGVFGLRRAFQLAGARTVIMSLWPVDDESARRWMTTLYQARLVKSLSTVEAVRAASITLLRDRRAGALSTHPFYWAAFVAAGDWR